MSSSRAMRIKKLSPKTILTVLLEGQIDASEYDSLTTEAKIATGVDAGEEDEIHLQAALKGAGQSTDNEIPVPPPQVSEEVKYEDLYSRPFVEPRGYIKSSDTVEETLSCLYDMTTEDDEFLKAYNQRRSSKLSEDDFERIMELFELTTAEQAPFAAVDNTTVSYEVMASQMANTPLSKLKTHTQAVYDHWKARRQSDGNKSLHPSLKFETPGQQDHDDMDPYVCFRRREVRQTRKTRQRDAMVADKLKKLRRELEDGRQLIQMAHQRELMKREMLSTERLLFEHRAKLKEKKVRLGIKEGDEDLYNTKPVKRKAPPEPQPAAKAAPQLRLAVRPEGRPAEQELVQLEDKEKERFDEFLRDIATKADTHRLWNSKYVDLTEKPLSPPRRSRTPASDQQKPNSSRLHQLLDDEPTEAALAAKAPATPFYFRGLSPEAEQPMPGYRRRIGRCGRLWIDRRNVGQLASPPSDSDLPQNDRFKYDEDDSDDEQPVYHIDPYDTRPMKFRAGIPLNIMRSYRPGQDGSVAAQTTPAARPALPPSQQGSTAGAVHGQLHVQQSSPSQQPSKQQTQLPPTPQVTA
ncbi:enhancer-polycomb 1 [Apiospora arundinis]